jgi:phosphatidylglycerophosphate synthase
VIGLLIAVVGAWFAANQSWLIAGLVVAFGAIFDLFDGALARATNRVSKFGAFLDSSLDRAGEGIVYIGVAYGLINTLDIAGAVAAMTAMASGYMVSYVRARSESLGFSPGTGMAAVGLAPREVRMAILVVGLLLGGIQGQSNFGLRLTLGIPGGVGAGTVFGLATVPVVLDWALLLITFLSVISAVQRILFTYNQSRSQTQEVSKQP